MIVQCLVAQIKMAIGNAYHRLRKSYTKDYFTSWKYLRGGFNLKKLTLQSHNAC